jgi:hypothetical protein
MAKLLVDNPLIWNRATVGPNLRKNDYFRPSPRRTLLFNAGHGCSVQRWWLFTGQLSPVNEDAGCCASSAQI